MFLKRRCDFANFLPPPRGIVRIKRSQMIQGSTARNRSGWTKISLDFRFRVFFFVIRSPEPTNDTGIASFLSTPEGNSPDRRKSLVKIWLVTCIANHAPRASPRGSEHQSISKGLECEHSRGCQAFPLLVLP